MEWAFYFLFWLGFSIVVGVAANTRGRDGGAWCLLAIIISPLLAGLFVLALPRLRDGGRVRDDLPPIGAVDAYPDAIGRHRVERVTESALSQSQPVFKPDGVLKGFPYRLLEDGTVDAMMTGGLVRFRDMEQLRAAAEGRDEAPLKEKVQVKDVPATLLDRLKMQETELDRLKMQETEEGRAGKASFPKPKFVPRDPAERDGRCGELTKQLKQNPRT